MEILALKKNLKKNITAYDYYLVIALICGLSFFGITVIGSVTNVHINPNSALQAMQQLTFVTGLFLFFIFSTIDYKFIGRFYWVIYFLNIALLLSVIFFGETQERANVTRQLAFGGFSVQPSQFSKIFMVLFLSKFIDKHKDSLNKIPTLIILGVLIALPVYLVYSQPSLSASLVVVFVSFTIIFVAGLHGKYIFAAVATLLPAGLFFAYDITRGTGNHILVHRFLQPFQIFRIYEMLSTEYIHMQNVRALQALGSGGLTGKGLYMGTVNNLNALAEAHNDMIFAVIGEEFGFIGSNIVLGLLFILILKCIFVAFRAETLLGKYIATGVGAMIFFQTFIHVGVVTNILPNTGIALPFISYGGSSMWALMISMGIVMNINKNYKPRSIFEEGD